jgi:two-component system response regulator YesN
MIKVVVIDDEKWIRNLIINLLPYNKYPISIVGEAEDGVEGLELISKVKPDIILTDIRMPLLSGLDLIKELNKKLPQSRIIIVSGYDSFDYAQTAIKYGVVDFILKPVEESELESAFKKAIKLIKKDEKLIKTKHLEKQVKRLSMDFIEALNDDYPHMTNEKIRKSLIYIDRNYTNCISLNDVSEAVFMNSSYFSDIFKKEVGIGFNQYLMDIRFKAAKKLLVEQKDLSIGDISTIVGFIDVNYFSRLFKKKFSCTPHEFRNQALPC